MTMNQILRLFNIRLRALDNIAPDKLLFSPESIDVFLISPRKHMLWVLIRSASMRHF